MSKMLALRRKPTLALRQRRALLLRSFKPPAQLLHASLSERFLKCGKPNCHCQTDGGPKHGPFFYLNRCFGPGQVQSLFLKAPDQIELARQGVAAYTQALAVLDELSQLNLELLRRGELPADV